jgi:hypothetical protein
VTNPADRPIDGAGFRSMRETGRPEALRLLSLIPSSEAVSWAEFHTSHRYHPE